jgi:hypothetical protein
MRSSGLILIQKTHGPQKALYYWTLQTGSGLLLDAGLMDGGWIVNEYIQPPVGTSAIWMRERTQARTAADGISRIIFAIGCRAGAVMSLNVEKIV